MLRSILKELQVLLSHKAQLHRIVVLISRHLVYLEESLFKAMLGFIM